MTGNKWNMIKDPHLRELVSASSIALPVKVLGAFSAFLMNVVVARKLGVSESGVFFLSLTLITLLSSVGRMGLDSSVVRFVADANASGYPELVNGVLRKVVLWGGGLSCLLSVLLIVLSEVAAEVLFSGTAFVPVLKWMALCLPLMSVYILVAHALRGLGHSSKSLIIINIVSPGLLAFALLIVPSHNANDAAYLYLSACGVTVTVGCIWWIRTVPDFSAHAEFSSARLWSSCAPLWGVVVFQQAIMWSSQLMLGIWSDSAAIALFATAQRIALLVSFVLVTVNSIVGPKFAAMYSTGDVEGLRRVAMGAVRLTLVIAAPIFIFIVAYREWLMGVFGEAFKAGATALLVLLIGQFINVAAGSVGLLLSMTGNERQLRRNVMIAALAGLGFGVVLIPVFGLIGGAFATALAVVIQNLLGVYQVNRLLGFNTLAIWRKG